MRKISILILLSVLYTNNNYAQQKIGGDKIQPVAFSSSPNAASLGSYGQVPTDLFTGKPNININLYNLQSNNTEIPISLSYNISSIKPEEHPGWTGLGWNLSAGGAITRMVNGGVDEVMVSGYTNPAIFSYYDNYSTLNSTDWYSSANMSNLYSNMTAFSSSFCAYPAPDQFMFNVNGLSGSFYKNHLGNWVVKANQKIDIKINDELKSDFLLHDEGNHPTDHKDFLIKRIIYGFTLTTDDGTQYIFGKNSNAIEFSANSDPTADSFHPNFIAKTWYLTQIILPTQRQINFEYARDIRATYIQNVSTDVQYYHVTGLNDPNHTEETYSGGLYTSKSLERIFNVYLSKITSDDTEIVFNKSFSQELDYDTLNSPWLQYTADYNLHHDGASYQDFFHWYKLDNIIVKRKSDGLQIKKIVFNYLENSTSRLFLNNVQESGLINTAVVKTHTFEYNQTPLPIYNAQKTDHWGYYNNTNFFTSVTQNGTSSAGTPIFTQQQLRDVYPTYRNPNPAVMQAGILTKITYPTKGFSEFYYEPNDFSQVINKSLSTFSLLPAISQNEIGGGLRIKKIVSNPGNSGANLIKEYFYVADYKNNNLTSSGILSGRPVYYEEGSASDFNFWRLRSYSILPLSFTNSNNVTYSNVVEKLDDGSFTEYNYANHDNGYIDKPANAYLISSNIAPSNANNHLNFNSLESERGNLLSEKKYNNQRVLVEKTDYLYNDDSNRFNDEIRSIDFYEDIYGKPAGGQYWPVYNHIKTLIKMTAYSIFTHQVYLKRTENTKYDLTNNSSITTTEDFTYSNLANHHHLKSKVSSTSNGNNFETKYFYSPDPEMINQPFISDFNTNNMKGIPLKTENYNGIEKIEEQKNTYAKDATTNNVLMPKNIYGAKFPNNLPSLPNDIGQLENKVTYDSYDDKGNITQYTQQDQIPVAVIWGYSKTQPIAKIVNATYSQVQSQVANLQTQSNTVGTEANLIIALNSLRTSLPNAMVTTFTFKPLIGVSTITDPKGQTTTYIYDDFNRLKQVKDNLGNVLNENLYNYKN